MWELQRHLFAQLCSTFSLPALAIFKTNLITSNFSCCFDYEICSRAFLSAGGRWFLNRLRRQITITILTLCAVVLAPYWLMFINIVLVLVLKSGRNGRDESRRDGRRREMKCNEIKSTIVCKRILRMPRGSYPNSAVLEIFSTRPFCHWVSYSSCNEWNVSLGSLSPTPPTGGRND